MQLVVLIICFNVLRYASSFPTPGHNDEANCLALEPESQNEIGTITDQISEFLCNLSPQYENIDISELEITVKEHSDEENKENTGPSVVVNDFTEDDSAEDGCDEVISGEAQPDVDPIETTSDVEPADEIDEATESDDSVNAPDTILEPNEESQTNENNDSQCDTQDEIIDDLETNEDAQGTSTENQVAGEEDNDVTVAILIDDVNADTAACDSNTNNDSEDIQDNQGNGDDQLDTAQDNGITVAFLVDNVKPDEINHNCELNNENDAEETRIVIADESASTPDKDQEGITIAIISEDVNPEIIDCDSNINNVESSNVNTNTQEINEAYQGETGDDQQAQAQDGITIAFLIDDVQPDEINSDNNGHKHTNNDNDAITIAFLSEDVRPDTIDCNNAANEANENGQGQDASIQDTGITIAFLIDG